MIYAYDISTKGLPTNDMMLKTTYREFPRNRQIFCWKLLKNDLLPSVILVTWLQ